MEIIILWIVFCFIVGFIGSSRKIGFGGAFFISLILSPLIGLLFTLFSKNKSDEEYKKQLLQTQENQNILLNDISSSNQTKFNSISVADELKKLKKLKEENSITEDEFLLLKENLINKN